MNYTTQTALRREFWAAHPGFARVPGQSQNFYAAHIRTAWCEFVDYMQKAGHVPAALAARATL